MIWAHEGTLGSFLSVVFRIFETKDSDPVIFSQEDLGLLEPEQQAPENPEWARRVLEGVRRRSGDEARSWVIAGFLSEAPGREKILLDFIRHCVRVGSGALAHKTQPQVLALEALAQSTRREAHGYMGLLRFRELKDGTLYAPFRPQRHVTPLLAWHFTDRLGLIPWMIHDLGRGCALLGAQGRWEFYPEVSTEQELEFSPEEAEFQALWQGFFRAAGVPGRENPELQKKKIPQKYWEFLIERP